jgi:hypothetical protein
MDRGRISLRIGINQSGTNKWFNNNINPFRSLNCADITNRSAINISVKRTRGSSAW